MTPDQTAALNAAQQAFETADAAYQTAQAADTTAQALVATDTANAAAIQTQLDAARTQQTTDAGACSAAQSALAQYIAPYADAVAATPVMDAATFDNAVATFKAAYFQVQTDIAGVATLQTSLTAAQTTLTTDTANQANVTGPAATTALATKTSTYQAFIALANAAANE